MVEVHDVIMDVLAGGDEVAQQPGVHRRIDVERGLDRTDRGERVHRRTHPADALREIPGVPRVAADEDLLQAAPHGGGGPGLGDLPAVDLRLDAQMPFDAGDRVYDDAVHVRPRPGMLGLLGTAWSGSTIGPDPADAGPVTGPRAVVALHPVLDRLAHPVQGEPGRGDRDHSQPDLFGGGVEPQPRHVREPVVEGGHGVPEGRFGAPDAAVTRPDGPVRGVVPLDGRAVVVAAGALASQPVQAPTLAVSLVAPLDGELAGVEMSPPWAVVVDAVAVGEQGAVQFVAGRQRPERQEMRQRGGEVVDVHRAARQVHDGHARDDVPDCDGVGRVRLGRRYAAVGGARAHVDDRGSAGRRRLQVVDRAAAADAAVGTIGTTGHRTLDDEQVAVRPQRRLERVLGLVARARHDRLLVVDGDEVEDQRRQGRVSRPKQRLGVAGAVLELEPNQAGFGLAAKSLGHALGEDVRQ